MFTELTVCSLAAGGLLHWSVINTRFHGFLVVRRCSRWWAGRVRSGGAGHAVSVVGGWGRLECWLCRLDGYRYGGRGRCRYDSLHIWNTTITRLLAYARRYLPKKITGTNTVCLWNYIKATNYWQTLSQFLTWMLVVLGSHDVHVSRFLCFQAIYTICVSIGSIPQSFFIHTFTGSKLLFSGSDCATWLYYVINSARFSWHKTRKSRSVTSKNTQVA